MKYIPFCSEQISGSLQGSASYRQISVSPTPRVKTFQKLQTLRNRGTWGRATFSGTQIRSHALRGKDGGVRSGRAGPDDSKRPSSSLLHPWHRSTVVLPPKRQNRGLKAKLHFPVIFPPSSHHLLLVLPFSVVSLLRELTGSNFPSTLLLKNCNLLVNVTSLQSFKIPTLPTLRPYPWCLWTAWQLRHTVLLGPGCLWKFPLFL